MARAMHACSTPGCPEITARAGRCEDCRREAEQRRGTAAQRGYGYKHRTVFREAVLRDQPVCQCPTDHYTHEGMPCLAWSTDADHKIDKRDLVAEGLDPLDAESYGRGLCHACHSYRTSQSSPGGWNQR